MTKEVQELSAMQQELLNRADSIFAAMKDAAVAAKDFAMDQLPDIVQQLIVFERVYLTGIVISPFVLLPLFLYLYYLVNKLDSEASDMTLPVVVLTIMSALGSLVGLISMIGNFKEFLMVWFSPKIFLIQYLTTLIKSVT